jgi:hypothetical protein
MTISIDWQNKLVLSTASITDIVAFKDTIRDFEDDDVGMLYDPIISYKRLDLGGGAYFHGVDFVNGYQLKFPSPGNYTVIGNIGATIVPVAGVFVDRTKSAAFATVAGSGGSTGPTAAEIAAAVRADMAAELAQITKVSKIHGVGVPLVVTPTTRTAGDIAQSITTVGDTTTVSAA